MIIEAEDGYMFVVTHMGQPLPTMGNDPFVAKNQKLYPESFGYFLHEKSNIFDISLVCIQQGITIDFVSVEIGYPSTEMMFSGVGICVSKSDAPKFRMFCF